MLTCRRGALAALIMILFGAGCANSSPSGASSAAPAAPSASASAETLSGTVAAGVEPDCLLLQGNGKPHLLIFNDVALKARAAVGASVTVVGVAKPAQMTTCQQGIPFLVSSLRVN
jgi:hypothetical protein